MNSGPKLVSVIMPCYNYASYLPESVNSVVSQSYKNFELIIINDGSSDDTLEMARRLKKKYSDHVIKIIDQKNQGVAESRNNGIRAASGSYILPLDPDDLIKPDCLEKLAGALDCFSDVAVAYPLVETFGTESGVSPSVKWDREYLKKKNYIPACSMFRKEAWAKVDGYKKTMRMGNEDWEFWISLTEAGYKFRLVDEPLYMWRKHWEGSRSRIAQKAEAELVYTMRCLHPSFFAPALTRFLGEIAARKYFRILMSAEKAYSFLFFRLLYPAYLSLKIAGKYAGDGKYAE